MCHFSTQIGYPSCEHEGIKTTFKNLYIKNRHLNRVQPGSATKRSLHLLAEDDRGKQMNLPQMVGAPDTRLPEITRVDG